MKNFELYRNKEKCPVRNILDRFGDKWSVLVIIILGREGTMRFNELNKTIGDISQKMLTVTLRTLEADGLVSREVFPEVPPRVEYTLTPMGESLLPLIEDLSDWAAEHFSDVLESRKDFAAP